MRGLNRVSGEPRPWEPFPPLQILAIRAHYSVWHPAPSQHVRGEYLCSRFVGRRRRTHIIAITTRTARKIESYLHELHEDSQQQTIISHDMEERLLQMDVGSRIRISFLVPLNTHSNLEFPRKYKHVLGPIVQYMFRSPRGREHRHRRGSDSGMPPAQRGSKTRRDSNCIVPNRYYMGHIVSERYGLSNI